MLDFERVSKIYFSPSGTTEKIVNEVAKHFDMNKESYDILSFDENKEFSDELVIIGVPVFNGRIPKLACERLSKIKGNNTKVIAILNYGNTNYGDALLELTELLKKQNFDVVGIACTVSQHSLFNEIGKNRPDGKDLRAINEFADKVIDKLENGHENELFVQGQKPFCDYTDLDYNVNCDYDLCIYCNDCVYTCPEEAITEDDPLQTDLDLCTRCSTCINVCSENARSFGGESYQNMKTQMENDYPERKENEFYL